MIKYDFQIDKEACFAYWAQSLVKWVWYFDVVEAEHYIQKSGVLSAPEKEALESLKNLLQKENNGYLWLWDRYAGKKIVNIEEQTIWNEIGNALAERFEQIWIEELPKLERWQKNLRELNAEKLEMFLTRTANFFGVNANAERCVAVKLLLRHRTDLPSGHVKQEFGDLVVLNISSVGIDRLDPVISTLVHETVHLFEYEYRIQSGRTGFDLLSESYSRIIKPHNLVQSAPSWRHLFVESIVTSMADAFSECHYWHYLNLADRAALLQKCRLTEFIYKPDEKKYSYQIRAVAARILPTTVAYLDKGDRIDAAYCDFAVQAWLDFRMGR
jgi:hypothetical protein